MKESTRIMKLSFDDVVNSLKNGEITACVIGIGRIGLPTALSFSKSGIPTIGVDINKELVEMINSSKFPLKDEPGYDTIFDEVIKNGMLKATTNIEDALSKADVILLSLPTPMNTENIPDYTSLKSVGKQLNQYMHPDSLVIVESTVEPGFVENDLLQIIEGDKKRLTAGENFSIGVCPETANPGEILRDFQKLPRLVGSIDEKTTKIITEIYKHVFPVDIIKMPNCKTANAVKLTTNVFRDINIAFINELSLLFEKLGIDTFTVLEAAKSKYNFQVHYPGAGVGGPCLPVNSYQLLNSARKVGDELLSIVKASRKTNEKMPDHVIDLIKDSFKELNLNISQSTILILGVSYKPDVKDIQLSPAEIIVKKLQLLGARVMIYDPFYKNANIFDIIVESDLEKALSQADGVVLVTAHKEFKDLDPFFISSKIKNKILVDSRGTIDGVAAKKAGLVFKGLGRGNF